MSNNSNAVREVLRRLGVSPEILAWLTALDLLAELRQNWDKSEHHFRTSIRDEAWDALHGLNTVAQKIVQQDGVTLEMIDEIAEWLSFDTGSGSDHHEEVVRDEAVKVLDKIATDSESQLRIGLLGLENKLFDPVITVWAANKLSDSRRKEAVAPLRAKLARSKEGVKYTWR